MSESLLRLTESAPQVMRRSQFFLWSQGDLQRWVPHKLLVCGAYERHDRDLHFDVFNSVPLPEGALDGFVSKRRPFIPELVRRWRLGRMRAARLTLSDMPDVPEVVEPLKLAGYTEMLVHGLCRPGRPNDLETLFIFSAPQHHYTDEELRSLDMLLPSLHMTYMRVHLTEREMDARSAGAGLPSNSPPNIPAHKSITARECEILRWVRDGMNNQQIAEKLGISSLTVKNHIQKILRKLGAANRAQAVAMAMAMNALGGNPDAQA